MSSKLFGTRDGISAVPSHSMELTQAHRPLLKIHAGYDETFPNSRDYLLRALDAGADIIEIDVQSAADGTMLALHDDILDGVSVCQKSFDELRLQLPTLLSLEEALQIASGYSGLINLDLKHPMFLESLSELIEHRGLTRQIILTGITINELKACRRFFPETQIWLSSPYRPDGVPLSERRDYEAECLHLAQSSGCFDLNLYIRNSWPELIRRLHANGVRTHVWTADTEADMQWLAQAGADSIATNYPAVLKTLLQRGNGTNTNEML